MQIMRGIAMTTHSRMWSPSQSENTTKTLQRGIDDANYLKRCSLQYIIIAEVNADGISWFSLDQVYWRISAHVLAAFSTAAIREGNNDEIIWRTLLKTARTSDSHGYENVLNDNYRVYWEASVATCMWCFVRLNCNTYVCFLAMQIRAYVFLPLNLIWSKLGYPRYVAEENQTLRRMNVFLWSQKWEKCVQSDMWIARFELSFKLSLSMVYWCLLDLQWRRHWRPFFEPDKSTKGLLFLSIGYNACVFPGWTPL